MGAADRLRVQHTDHGHNVSTTGQVSTPSPIVHFIAGSRYTYPAHYPTFFVALYDTTILYSVPRT